MMKTLARKPRSRRQAPTDDRPASRRRGRTLPLAELIEVSGLTECRAYELMDLEFRDVAISVSSFGLPLLLLTDEIVQLVEDGSLTTEAAREAIEQIRGSVPRLWREVTVDGVVRAVTLTMPNGTRRDLDFLNRASTKWYRHLAQSVDRVRAAKSVKR